MSLLPVMSRRAIVLASLVMSGGALGLASCGGDDSASSAPGAPVVAATAPQIDGLLRQLAGKGIAVASVVAATADVHELELRPSQVRALKSADLILRPGRSNDAWAQEALGSLDAKQVDLAADLPGKQRHWWMDPSYAETAAKQIVSELDRLDPAGSTARADALTRVVSSLQEIDRETKQCLDTVPADHRAIVTDHDAAGAYAERYGLRVVGTIAPGAEPEAAPSAQRIVELVSTMERERVAAVFPIAPHGSELSSTIAKRGGAVLGGALWADALPGTTHDHDHGHEATGHSEETTGHSDETAGHSDETTDHSDGSAEHTDSTTGHADHADHAGDSAGHADHADETTGHADSATEHDEAEHTAAENGGSTLEEAAHLNGQSVAKALGAKPSACGGLLG